MIHYAILSKTEAKNVARLITLLSELRKYLIVIGSVARRGEATTDIDFLWNVRSKTARKEIVRAVRKSGLVPIVKYSNNWTFRGGNIQAEILANHAGPEWSYLHKRAKRAYVQPLNMEFLVARAEDAKINPEWEKSKREAKDQMVGKWTKRQLISAGCYYGKRKCGGAISQRCGGAISQRCGGAISHG